MRFKISEVDDSPVQKMGNITNIDTERDRFIYHSESIDTKVIANGKIRYNTGFLKECIEKNKHFTADYKKEIIKAQASAYKLFVKDLTGSETGVIEDTDKTVWEDAGYGSITITNDTFSTIFDTKDVRSLVAYWQILSRAYNNIGCNMQDAIEKGSKYFIEELQNSEIRESENENLKIKAITILGNLKETDNSEALLYLCWALGSRKEGMAGFSKSTTPAILSKFLYNFIQGDTKSTAKKQAPHEFISEVNKYNADKDAFMIKVIVKIADYHNIISKNQAGSYIDEKNIVIGKTIEECVINLAKASMRDVFDNIYKTVMGVLSNTL